MDGTSRCTKQLSALWNSTIFNSFTLSSIVNCFLTAPCSLQNVKAAESCTHQTTEGNKGTPDPTIQTTLCWLGIFLAPWNWQHALYTYNTFVFQKNIIFSKRGSSAATGCFPDLSVISPAWALRLQCIFTWQRVDQPVSSCASLSCQVWPIKRTAHPWDRQPGKGKKKKRKRKRKERYSSFSLGWHSSKDSETHYKYSWRGRHFYFRPQSKCSSWGSARWCPCLS